MGSSDLATPRTHSGGMRKHCAHEEAEFCSAAHSVSGYYSILLFRFVDVNTINLLDTRKIKKKRRLFVSRNRKQKSKKHFLLL